MLRQLTIKNIVLIDTLEIPFREGFCVLTGETGAGKSILLDALQLALGARAEARLLKAGAEQGSVTAEFTSRPDIDALLKEQDVPAEGELLLRRVLYKDGRSKAYINDCPISQQFLEQVGERLVEIHGQHDQRGLLSAVTHRAILDGYAAAEKESAATEKAYSAWQAAAQTLAGAEAQAAKAKAEEDFLRHALKELSDLNPEKGEEETLAHQRTLMMNHEKIATTLQSAMRELSGEQNVSDSLRAASRILERSNLQGSNIFEPAIKAIDRAIIEADEATEQLETIAGNMELDTNRLEHVEERLFGLRTAARKYQVTVDELPEKRKAIAAQLELVENTEGALAKLKAEVEKAKEAYSAAADKLSEKRKKAAGKLEKAIAEELAPLKMASSKLKVELQTLEESDWGAAGKEKIQFLVQTNPGSPFGSLSKIASGGELSRFMLALKVALSDVKSAPTIVFDEIDTGIGGAVADAVGKRLAQLGKEFQVMAVTHQPQVAALGTHHLKVEKEVKKGAAETNVQVLDASARKEELARMLAGSTITEEARAAAVKLMGAG